MTPDQSSVTRVAVGTQTRAPSGRSTAHVVDGPDGTALLVDPAARDDDLDRAVETHDAGHVAVTHHHPDHVGGVADYADAYDLTVWARAGRLDDFEAAAGVAPNRVFRPGETIPPADVSVVDTPGHAPEHVAFAAGNDWLVGDLAVAAGSVVVGAPEGDMRAYLTSLRRTHAHSPERLLPAHGPVIEHPQATCVRLIERRLDRERQVLAAVEAGNETAASVTRAAYDRDVSDVFVLAKATTVAHLEKLAVEGKLRWDGSRAVAVD